MKLTTVLKNSFFYTLASVLQGMFSFFLLPLYTRYLSPADYAILALVASFIGIVSVIITLQIHTGIPRFVIKFLRDQKRAKIYFGSITLILFTMVVVSCLAINFFGDRIIKIVFLKNNNVSYVPFFQIAVWTALPNLLIGSCLLLLQTLERGGTFFLVTAIQVAVNVCCGVIFVVLFKLGVMGILWAQFISAVIGLFCVIWVIRDWLRFNLKKFPLQDIKDSLRYSLPIIPHMLSMYIYMYSDRLILQRYVPLADVGIYSIADTFAYILLIIVNATTTAYSPRFLKLAEKNKTEAQEEAKRFIEIWWVGIMAIFMGYLLFSGYIVKLMTRPSFYPSIPLISILAIAYIFRGLYCFATNSIFYMEKTKFIPVITVGAAAVNVALNLIFIPRFGIYAAAWSTVVAYLVTFMLAYHFSQKYYPVIYPWQNMLKITLLLLAGYICVRFFNVALSSYNSAGIYFNVIIFISFIVAAFFVVPKQYGRFITDTLRNFFVRYQ